VAEFNTQHLRWPHDRARGHALRAAQPRSSATSIELTVQAHRYDAMVLIGSCDKIIPALLMAAARLDPGDRGGGWADVCGLHPADRDALGEAAQDELAAALPARRIPVDLIEEGACALSCAGACSGMGTANTMACLTEAVGMSPPATGRRTPPPRRRSDSRWRRVSR
jgi:dihydroxy-acid dehydratase